eukprot:TRINITY_DN16209_c0_g2_i1.p2 TRINITY_DN16209_c0_g2~~TRINITY_DN16209_c0_g2_i1.p2  ORF type:complete len:259 (-),score=57.04 TRINITY_DN16209_c0_g2_i1:156-932(-)
MCDYGVAEGTKCRYYGESCSRAHGMDDLRDLSAVLKPDEDSAAIESIMPPFNIDTFRTVECPSSTKCKRPDCTYFHNELQRRRNPKLFNYNNGLCPYIIKEGKLISPANCSQGDKCNFCHTENELCYHKLNYKKKPCERKPCLREAYCPDIHQPAVVSQKQVREDKKLDRELRESGKFWRCNRCGSVIDDMFYYLKACQNKLCEGCKGRMVKEGIYKCMCGKLHDKLPTKILLREFRNECIVIEDDEPRALKSEMSDI